ncbi:nucleotide-diphospho-sugar transferase [Pelagophyceae sp. CCMP2097]|nr:nucleotide-diphospho-sugar transferase [Pelagophyceae sp. CCMP2097]
MAPARKKAMDEDCRREQVLQAVVLADSFEGSFRPATLDGPKVLLPLCGVPMLDYTLEVLAKSGVGEIFVVCVSHAEKVAAYLDEQRATRGRWVRTSTGADLVVKCLAMKGCASAGDALRELDQRGVVQSDPFVLISGDVVTNVDVGPIIEAHRARKKLDPDATMTVLMMKSGSRSQALRPLVSEDVVLALHSKTQQILAWHDDVTSASVALASGLFARCDQVEIRSDLTDCHIDVCSPEVLWRYSENFDYLDRRKDFVTMEVANVELGQKVFAHELEDSAYAARLHDPRVYDAVTNDVLERWCHPLVPDAPAATWAGSCTESTTAARRGVYKGVWVKIPRSTDLHTPVLIGSRSKLGENVTIRHSTLCDDAILADGSSVVRSHLGARCTIAKNASVDCSLLGDDVVVQEGARVCRGCVLGAGVVVGAGVVLKAFSRITARRERRTCSFDAAGSNFEAVEDEDGVRSGHRSSPGTTHDCALLGVDGVGRNWRQADLSDDDVSDDDDDGDDVKEQKARFFRAAGIDVVAATAIGSHEVEFWRNSLHDDFDDEEEYEAEEEYAQGRLRANSHGLEEEFDSVHSDADGFDADFGTFVVGSTASQSAFAETVRDMIATGANAGADVSSMIMELNCYKLSENRSFKDIVPAAVESVVSFAAKEAKTKNALISNLKKQLTFWRPLLAKLVAEDEAFAVHSLETLALSDQAPPLLRDPAVFRAALQLLYEGEIISGDGILAWADSQDGENETQNGFLRKSPQVEQFLAWLQEDDEDEETDEEKTDEED